MDDLVKRANSGTDMIEAASAEELNRDEIGIEVGLSSTAVDDRNADQSAINAAFRRGQEDMRARAARVMDDRADGCRLIVGMNAQGQCEGGAEDIRALPIKDKEE